MSRNGLQQLPTTVPGRVDGAAYAVGLHGRRLGGRQHRHRFVCTDAEPDIELARRQPHWHAVVGVGREPAAVHNVLTTAQF